MPTFVIVGTGHAGGRAAEAMRKHGFDGRVVLIGTEPHLPHERPPLSKGALLGTQDYESCLLHQRAFYDEQAIELRNLSTTLRHRRFLFTDSFLLLWKWRVG